MTRIVSGKAGGRRLRVPHHGTRPTSERVREALFNALEVTGELDGARVLDLYAGTGALGLEALSRGAAEALFVESDRRAVEALRANIASLGLGGTVRPGRVETVLAQSPSATFEVVLADPPYAQAGSLGVVLGLLDSGGWIEPEGLVVVERGRRDGDPDWPDGFRVLRTKSYGDTVLHWAEYVP